MIVLFQVRVVEARMPPAASGTIAVLEGLLGSVLESQDYLVLGSILDRRED